MSTISQKILVAIMIIVLTVLITACSGYETAVEEVQKLVDDGKYDEALTALEKLKETYKANKELNQKIDEVRNLISIKKSDETYNQAVKFLENGDYVSAYNAFMKVIKDDVKNYASAQAKMNEIADAAFRQLVNYAKTDAEKKMFDAAAKWARDALAIKPDENIEKLLAKYEEEAEKAEVAAKRQRAIETMQTYERGTGDIGIACITKKTTRFNTGFTTYTANKGYIFLHVGLSAKNYGNDTVHVNPTFVTISTPDGSTYNPHTETTYSMNNYFDAIDLSAGGSSDGWLIFCVPVEDEYTLHYNGLFDKVDKKIIVME
ncbi:MAG: DUF4352 domain-containing protein [Firmicutes bacterium]|nr:DUF4352 domain-containing protein [Bacillota bacterium]